MSAVNAEPETVAINKNNELVLMNSREEIISENPWVIRVSKTHPGLKYYFNIDTGVSLWNISREDMERAKQTLKANQNPPLYINCPEPKESPPRKLFKSLPLQTCEQISQQPKNLDRQLSISGFSREKPGFKCDICPGSVNSSSNFITAKFRACPHSAYSTILENVHSPGPQSQTQPSSVFIDNSTLETNHCNKGLSHVSTTNRDLKRTLSETMSPSFSNENLHNKSNTNTNILNHNATHPETLDLTALKMFANNCVNKNKWYIIADADVYLHHITLLEAVVKSDKQCCLMVPQNVRIDIENATKTKELKTKAYFASYYIYNMFDHGIAEIDEGGSHHIRDKSNEEHILDCCSKLKEDNFYVIVITNDIELQKYRNKIYIPIFTTTELKEYIYKSSNSVTTKAPEPTFNLPQSSKNIKVSTSNLRNNKVPDAQKPIITNVRTSLLLNDKGLQVRGVCSVSKISSDAEIQTDFHQTQLEEKEILISNSQSCEPTLHSSICGPSHRIKLKRRKLVEKSENDTDVIDTITISPHNMNLLHKEQSKKPNIKITVNENFKPNKITKINNVNEELKENYTISKRALVPRENIESKNVMFEIASEAMDQSLKRRSDEWVSRFVQIMEEALTQVLRKNSSYLPPPWNLYEAAICIEKRFNTDEDVADASKKFLNILHEICDEKGNINANITPSQFMEMYSFGVYVIDALQTIFSICDDLQSAAESLSKLVNDIQNSESDMKNLDENFINDTENADDTLEEAVIVESVNLPSEGSAENNEPEKRIPKLPNLTETVTNENVVSNDCTERHREGTTFKITFNNAELSDSCVSNDRYAFKKHIRFKETNAKCNNKSQGDNIAMSTENVNACNTRPVTSPSGYNLRPRRKSISIDDQDQQVSPENCLDVSKNESVGNTFVSNLSHEKNKEKVNANDHKDITIENIPDEVDSSGFINSNGGCSYQFSSPTPELSHKVNTNSNEPKVVRHFVVCPEFEDRLKTSLLHDEMEELEYEEEEDIVEAMKTYKEQEVPSCGTGRQINEFHYRDNKVNDDTHIEQEIISSPEYITIDLKYFMGMIAQDIKKMSIDVYDFSKSACESLNSMSTSNETRRIREKAEELHFYVDKVCTALTNILDRDKHGRYNVQALLKNTEFNDISVDEDQIQVYGEFISRCLEQAHDLNNTIKDILSAVCEQ